MEPAEGRIGAKMGGPRGEEDHGTKEGMVGQHQGDLPAERMAQKMDAGRLDLSGEVFDSPMVVGDQFAIPPILIAGRTNWAFADTRLIEGERGNARPGKTLAESTVEAGPSAHAGGDQQEGGRGLCGGVQGGRLGAAQGGEANGEGHHLGLGRIRSLMWCGGGLLRAEGLPGSAWGWLGGGHGRCGEGTRG